MKALFFEKTMALALVTSLAFGCAKTRTAELAESEKNGTFEISEIQGSAFNVSTLGSSQSDSTMEEKMSEAIISSKVSLDANSAPEKVRFLFKNAEAYDLGSGEVKIMLGLDKSNLTAYQEATTQQLANRAELSVALSAEEVQARQNLGKSATSNELRQVEGLKLAREKSIELDNQVVYIPLFKVALKSYGIIQKKRNDLKEETSVLELKATDWDRATHIQISDLVKDRSDISIDSDSASEFNAMISLKDVQSKNLNYAQLNAGLKLSGDQSLKLNKSSVFYSKLNGQSLEVYEYVVLTETLSAAINKNADLVVLTCSDKINQDLKTKNLSCALVKRLDISLEAKRLQLDSAKGIDASTVSLKAVKDVTQARKASIKEIKVSNSDNFGISDDVLKTSSDVIKASLSQAQ